MYLLARVFPGIRRWRIPLTRDQWMLLLMAIMLIAMGAEVYTGHKISGTIVPNEWIPIVFGPTAGVALLVAGALASTRRGPASWIANLVFMGSILIGFLGAYFHLSRAMLPSAPAGQSISVDLLIWAPPVIAPLMFALIGILGMSAVWLEDPVDSGIVMPWPGLRVALPFSKTRAFLVWTGLAMLATVISSVLDHARSGFTNPWLWVPTSIGIFATVVTLALAFLEAPGRADLMVYLLALALLIVTGPVGAYLHIRADLVGRDTILIERLLRGAPIMAPLLFSNMGLLGLFVLLDPRERGASRAPVPPDE